MANFNLNKVILGGRLTANAELKTTPSGVAVCSFTLAVNRKTAKDKEAQTDFIKCVAWRQTAEFISTYFSKGSSICVIGSIQTRSWTDQNNQKCFATEVIVDEANFVDSKNESTPSAPANVAPQFEEVSSDEELPF